LQNKLGPDGLIHEEDGTKRSPTDGKAIEDDGDLEDEKGNKLPKRDDFATEAASKNR
jgi:hypothetical protein